MKRTISIAILLCGFCHPGFAQIRMNLPTPQDDPETRKSVLDRPELVPSAADYYELVHTRLWPLKLDQVTKIFGPKLMGPDGKGIGMRLENHPADLVLTIAVPSGLGVSGMFSTRPDAAPISHADLHAIGDIGYPN